jgi:capsule polysaccharide export protein KpsE/RkpR
MLYWQIYSFSLFFQYVKIIIILIITLFSAYAWISVCVFVDWKTSHSPSLSYYPLAQFYGDRNADDAYVVIIVNNWKIIEMLCKWLAFMQWN